MKPLPLAGLLGLAALGAQAQMREAYQTPLDPIVVTASRGIAPATTLRDATVITRADIESSGALSLGELLQRRAGVELRATGGPGQPQGIFIRGSGTAQTLVLIDGMRAGSATVGTTAIENIPLELIERIEVVKGPLSSLYGSDAIGGVVQIFTRGKDVPHLFGSAGYGTDNDWRLSTGLTTVDGDAAFSLSAGARTVNARSATNERVAFGYNPDRDPHDSAFGNLRASYRMWQGEMLAIEAFGSRGRTDFDGGGDNDRNDQTIAGARIISSTHFTDYWSSRITVAQGRDKLEIHGNFPDSFETRQDQAEWINEFNIPGGTVVAGFEALRQKVISDATAFTNTRRDTNSIFAGVNQSWVGQRFEASARRDDDDAYGARNTGSVGYGVPLWSGGPRISYTVGRGFRAPTFYDLYGPTSDFYQPNPQLRPEQSKSRELSVRSEGPGAWRWRITAFDNRIEDLIVYSAPTVLNVNSARIRGVEASAEGSWSSFRWQASATFQRPRDEDTGLRLQGRAERFGTVDVSRRWGNWTGGLSVYASGDRFDSTNEAPASHLPAYAVVDARVRYQVTKMVAIDLAATNLFDRRYETAVGYDGARRGVMLSVRFDAF